jgi:type III secretion protein U
MSDEKTEEPTQKKLDDAKKKGQSPKSQDVNAAASVLGLMICLMVMGESMLNQMSRSVLVAIERGTQVRSDTELLAIMTDVLQTSLLTVLPFLAASVVLGLASAFAQVGAIVSFEAVELKFDKLNPAEGLKKIFSVRSLIDFAKMVIKAVALGAVVWVMVKDMVPLLVGAAYLPPLGIGAIGWTAMLKLLGAASIVFIIIGPVDFGIQKWLFVRDQKMSKDEVKREHKESEGDPELKGKRKQLAHEMATSAPEKRVPGSSVVVTNPTHYAVALRYDPSETPLPVVVAKGLDAEAMRIRGLAEQHGVPIVGNPPLARSLHMLEIDEPIPEHLFEAVATVMRWVQVVKKVSTPPEPKGSN